MPLQTFDPPGFVDDLSAEQRQAWHEFISSMIDAAMTGDQRLPNNSPRPQFMNPAKTEITAQAGTEDIKWTAFPRIVTVGSGSDRDRWRRADASRGVQDEYCEWSVKRDPATGKIVHIDFTCEGPEYWTFLASVNQAKTLELYRAHVDPLVQMADLYDASGRYDPTNRWNNSTSEGAMHLIQRNNTLGAEIEIAGAATIVRLRPDGQPMTDQRELILCGAYGAPERNSDPFIGARVNFWARQAAALFITNPVGIYFAGLNTQEWETPDGSDPATLWRIVRGTPDRPVRAVLSVREGKGFGLGDVLIRGKALSFGAQVADDIQMTIRALADRIGQVHALPVQGCVTRGPVPQGLVGGQALSVAEALAKEPRRGRL